MVRLEKAVFNSWLRQCCGSNLPQANAFINPYGQMRRQCKPIDQAVVDAMAGCANVNPFSQASSRSPSPF